MVAALLLSVAAPVSLSPSVDAQPIERPSGTLLVPRDGQIALIDAASGAERPMRLPGSGVVADLAWSPDGSKFAASRLARRDDGTIGRDVQVFAAEGGEPLAAFAHDASRVYYGSPTWAPDGQAVLFDRQEAARPPSDATVERASVDGGARRSVAQNARMPAITPDGSTLIFVRWGATDSLLALPLEGGPERTIIAERQFLAIATPRVSPDGAWIAFAAVGGGLSRQESLGASYPGLPSLATPAKHGFPWDVWLVRPDGSELQRLSDLGEDDATIAWAPDSRWVAVYGGFALSAVSLDEPLAPVTLASGGFGGFDWR